MFDFSRVISDYLCSQLDFLNPSQNIDENLYTSKEKLVDLIYQRVTDPRYRRTAIDKETEKDTRGKIDFQVKRDFPISFSLPCGAYKNWRIWSYPEPEWAEIFNLNYMIKYIYKIAKIYKPGVVFNYSYGDNVMDIVSNMPSLDTDCYTKGIKELISFFQLRMPENIKLNAVCINQFYSNLDEHKKELIENYLHNRKNWDLIYSPEIRKKNLTVLKGI